MFLLPMYVAVAHFARREIPRDARDEMSRGLLHAQNADGSAGVYAGGPGSMFTSSLAYAALRLLGVRADDPNAMRMAEWVRARGTPLRSAPWGKHVLALIDLYDYDGLDPVPPELWLLPYALPFHPARMWCHARQVYLPMAYLYGRRARRCANDLVRAIRDELYGPGSEHIDWRRHRWDVSPTDDYQHGSRSLAIVERALFAWERVAPRSLRRRAIEKTYGEVAYEDAATSFIRIGPVNAVLDTAVHADRDPNGLDAKRGFDSLERYLWRDSNGISMQGYNSSQLWDTAFVVQSVLATPCARDFAATLERAHAYIRDNQILEDPPRALAHHRDASRGGWPFSNRPHGWPIADCTAEAFKCALALEGNVEQPVDEELLVAAVERMLAFQNVDGGFGTYERQRASPWLEAFNPSRVFGDIMVDHSFTECTSAVVQALAAAEARFPRFGARLARAIRRGAAFIRKQQREDGGWEGSWGVCFTYGTWFAVSGLLAAGARHDDAAIRRGCAFLLAHQRDDGAWGEKPESCWQRRYVSHERGQVVMTSWALSTLARARCDDRAAMERAATFLVARQEADGSWARESFAGVFNRTCMINYDNYRLYFPVMALGEWMAAERHIELMSTSRSLEPLGGPTIPRRSIVSTIRAARL
jgi:squalene/oxidosqualene cyclase-like protein